jgi:serine/threonine protein kinase
MDYAEGQDLRAWCEAQGGADKVPLAARLEIVAQVADALQAAHQTGVIHRDVKPSNILIAECGARSAESGSRGSSLSAKLTDFGIGQVVSQEALAGMTRMGFTQTMVGPGSSSHTGTQMYMAPELIAGQGATARSDIYSLGVVLYQLLVGDFARPLTTDWAKRIRDALLREDLEKCFAGTPEERFASAGELAQRLRELDARLNLRLTQLKVAWRWKVARAAGVFVAIMLLVLTGVIWSLRKPGPELGGTNNMGSTRPL